MIVSSLNNRSESEVPLNEIDIRFSYDPEVLTNCPGSFD